MDPVTTASSTAVERSTPTPLRWRAALSRAAIPPVLVLLPLLALAPMADNRFFPYLYGGEYVVRPWLVVTDQLRRVPEFLEHGNFRPLGRMLERSLDLLTYLVSGALSLPMTTALRLVHLLGAVVLVVALVILAETVAAPTPLRRSSPSRVSLVLPFAFAMGLVAAGSRSSVVIFTDLYFLSSALVVAVAAAAARHGPLLRSRLGPGPATAAVLVGAAAASHNELGYLAAPLAVVAVVARGRLTLGRSWRELAGSAAAKSLALGWLGFLAVLVPIRIVIARICADGSCYDNSAVAVGPELLPALGHRLVSWVPLPFQYRVLTGEPGPWPSVLNPITLLLLAALVGAALVAARSSARESTARQCSALATVAASLLLLGAVMAATSGAVQEHVADGWALSSGWRETPLTVGGGAMLITAGLLAGARRDDRVRWTGMAVLVVLAGCTLVTNQGYARSQAVQPESLVHNRIAVSVTNFVDDEMGEAERCELLAEFAALHPDRGYWHTRLEDSLDATTRARYGRDFCDPEADS